MPWHDVHIRLQVRLCVRACMHMREPDPPLRMRQGPSVRDVVFHFAQRWNHCKLSKGKHALPFIVPSAGGGYTARGMRPHGSRREEGDEGRARSPEPQGEGAAQGSGAARGDSGAGVSAASVSATNVQSPASRGTAQCVSALPAPPALLPACRRGADAEAACSVSIARGNHVRAGSVNSGAAAVPPVSVNQVAGDHGGARGGAKQRTCTVQVLRRLLRPSVAPL